MKTKTIVTSPMLIAIEGEVCTVKTVHGNGYLPLLEMDNGEEWYFAPTSEYAGEKAREYWRELVENDLQEAVAMLGAETLSSWALGRYAGPGSTFVRSLEEWLDLWLDTPEEEWASWDSRECECTINRNLRAAIHEAAEADFPEMDGLSGVCYRHN